MAFEKISSSRGSSSFGCGIAVTAAGRSKPNVKYKFSLEIMNELGWTPDTRVSILWGTDKDAGRIMISPSNDGLLMSRPGRRSAYLQSPVVPNGTVLTLQSMTGVDHEITGEGLILQAPSFLMPPVSKAAE